MGTCRLELKQDSNTSVCAAFAEQQYGDTTQGSSKEIWQQGNLTHGKFQGICAATGHPAVSSLPICELTVVKMAGWEVADVRVHSVLN